MASRKPQPLKSLRYEGRCKICQRSVREPKLHKLILNSKHFFPSNKDSYSLRALAEDYAMNYNALMRHTKAHVSISPDKLAKIEMERLAKRQEAQSKLEDARALGTIEPTSLSMTIKTSPTEVWDDIIDKAREGLQDGTIKLNANHLLKAAKDKSDYEIKKKNQDIAIQEMMWHFASGEAFASGKYDRKIIEGKAPTDYDPTEISAGYIDEGEERSSSIHSGTSGDATTSWTDQVFEGDDF